MTTQASLFHVTVPARPAPTSPAAPAEARALGQYPTPGWAAEALVRHHLTDLDSSDVVLEPSCGAGRFLAAIPAHVPAVGVEIDPTLAAEARRATGRPVITGDFRTVDLDVQPTVAVGNPPFETKVIEAILDRTHSLLPEEGRVCFVLPAYFFQTSRRTLRYSEQWSIAQEMLPQNLFHGLKHPLVFATFRKDRRRLLMGFALYAEHALIQTLPAEARKVLDEVRVTWPTLVVDAISACGGEATLSEIYDYVTGRQPTANPAWREQVRKVCQRVAQRTGRGRYAVAAA